MTQIRQNVLPQRQHAREQLRQHGGEVTVPLRVHVVHVRAEVRPAVVVHVDVRGQPLEPLRELVPRIAVRRILPGPLRRPAHLPYEAEQRGMHEVEHLPVGAGMPVPLLLGHLLQHPYRLPQPRLEPVVDERVGLPHPVHRRHLGTGPLVPQRRIVGELVEHVPHLRLGEPLRDRLLGPPGDDAGIAHLLEPPWFRPQLRAALHHHLDLPQRPRDGGRRGTACQKRQRKSGQPSQLS